MGSLVSVPCTFRVSLKKAKAPTRIRWALTKILWFSIAFAGLAHNQRSCLIIAWPYYITLWTICQYLSILCINLIEWFHTTMRKKATWTSYTSKGSIDLEKWFTIACNLYSSWLQIKPLSILQTRKALYILSDVFSF